MRQETPQREPHLYSVDRRLRAFGYAGAQDVDRQRDHDALVSRELLHGSVEVVRLEAHDVLWIHAFGMRWSILVARLRFPSFVTAVGRA